VLIFVLVIAIIYGQPFNNRKFYHSSCIAYIGACFDTAPNTCFVCANSIYCDKDFKNAYNPRLAEGPTRNHVQRALLD
jgi:hypothetical protein